MWALSASVSSSVRWHFCEGVFANKFLFFHSCFMAKQYSIVCLRVCGTTGQCLDCKLTPKPASSSKNRISRSQEFPSGLVVKDRHCHPCGEGSIPGWELPHAEKMAKNSPKRNKTTTPGFAHWRISKTEGKSC